MARIEDGRGTGRVAKVNIENRLAVQAVTAEEAHHAVEEGRAYNINTGIESLTAETAILYLKNNEDNSIFIEALAIGVGAGTFATTSFGKVTVIKNPTTGTCISGATPVAMNENRDFGSSKTLVVDAYVGASGETFTNGTDVAILATPNAQSRGYFTIGMVLEKGNSIGIKFDPNLASGATDVYAALITHINEVL